jgi:hypothetical protein
MATPAPPIVTVPLWALDKPSSEPTALPLLENSSDFAPSPVEFLIAVLLLVKPNDWTMSPDDASSMVNLSLPVASLVRIKRLSVLEMERTDAVTPVALVPELALSMLTAISASVSVVLILIALPFITNSPEIPNAVVESV